jgi:hypothetical protein
MNTIPGRISSRKGHSETTLARKCGLDMNGNRKIHSNRESGMARISFGLETVSCRHAHHISLERKEGTQDYASRQEAYLVP